MLFHFFKNFPHVVSVISKGCAHDCQNLPPREGAHCLLCKGLDFCNSPQTEIGQGTIMRQQPPPPQIGGGAVPDNGECVFLD